MLSLENWGGWLKSLLWHTQSPNSTPQTTTETQSEKLELRYDRIVIKLHTQYEIHIRRKIKNEKYIIGRKLPL